MSVECLLENARVQREDVIRKVRAAMAEMRKQVMLHAGAGAQLPWRLSTASVLSLAGVDKKTLRQPYHEMLRGEVGRFLQEMGRLANASVNKASVRKSHGPRALVRQEVDKAQLIYALQLQLREARDELAKLKGECTDGESGPVDPAELTTSGQSVRDQGKVLQFPMDPVTPRSEQ